MSMLQLNKRLDALEQALSSEVVTCDTCKDWLSILIRFQDVHGAILKDVNDSNGWPVDTATCPGCGRQPEVNIFLGSRSDGPQ